MPEIIGYCGLNCCTCPIYVATREKNDEKRRRMRAEIAVQIKKHYGVEYQPEDITDCDGCRSENDRLFAGSKNCRIRKCARPKRIENCAHCSEYACDKLKEFFVKDPEAKTRLDVIRSTL
jgi:hypothetical protein